MGILSYRANRLNLVADHLSKELGFAPGRLSTEPYFTGWKEDPNNGSIVGQVVLFVRGHSSSDPVAAYVNLPGMQAGVVPQGATFDIGIERLDPDTNAVEMRKLLQKGLERMKKLIEDLKLVPYMEGK